VARVFTPKDFGLTEIMGHVVDVIREANGLDQQVPAPV
jgi:(2R)-ethylmalonyl-CoA mutase